MNPTTPESATRPEAPPAEPADATVERITRVGSSIVGGCYVVGLLVANTYLYQFGANDYSLLRPKAVFTGAWVVLLIVVLGMPTISVMRRSLLPNRDGTLMGLGAVRRFWRNTLASVAGSFFLGVFVCFLWGDYRGVGWIGRLTLSAVSAFGLYTAAVGLVGILAMAHRRQQRSSTIAKTSRVPTADSWLWTAAGAAFVLVFAGFLANFAQTLYPGMPNQFGGGQSQIVRLALNPEGVSLARHLGIQTLLCTNETERLDMLYAGDAYVIIRNTAQLGATLQLRSELIEAIHVPRLEDVELLKLAHHTELVTAIQACAIGNDRFDELLGDIDKYEPPLAERLINSKWRDEERSAQTKVSQ